MKNTWLKRGLTCFLIAAVCCCFMPGLALAAEGTDAEQAAPAASAPAAPAAAAAKGTVSIQGVIAPAAKEGVTVQAAADKKDKSLLHIKTVNGTKEDVKVQVFLWKNDKTLTDGKKDNDKKEIAADVNIGGGKIKLIDTKDGRYFEFTVKAGKTDSQKIKLETTQTAKDKTAEVIVEVRFADPKAAEPAPAEAKTGVPASAEPVTTGTETNKNAAANDADKKEDGDGSAANDEDKKDEAAEPEKIEVAVEKVWSDEDDKDKIRPANVTIKLFADGTDTGKTLILDAAGSWKGSFKDLDKQKDGKDIAYTVQEVEVKDYKAEVTGDQTAGFKVTNTHTPAADADKVIVSGTVTWNDNNDKAKKRPAKVTIRLFANGEEMQLTRTNADAEWKYEFKDLDKADANGKDIKYTIKQDTVTGYSTTYKGYDVTNKYKTSSSSSAAKKSSSTTSKKSPGRNAKTGDSTHPGLYLVLMLVAAAGIVTMVLRRRRG